MQPYSLQKYENFSELVSKIKPQYFETNITIDDHMLKIKNHYTKLQNYHRSCLFSALASMTSLNGGDGKGANQNRLNAGQLNQNDGVRRGTPVFSLDPNHPAYNPHLHNLIQTFITKDQLPNEGNNYSNLKNGYLNHEKKQEAVILLQRLIRGRAMQNCMFDGKEKRLALIDELLIVSNIDELDKDKEQELLKERQRERVKNAYLESLQGEVIVDMLEGLSTELLRFKEEKKVAQWVEKAEKERRKREAEETGTRQAEITLRHREDVLYGEIMKVHQGTVDTFLSNIMGRSIEHLSSKQAITMAKLREHKFEKNI